MAMAASCRRDEGNDLMLFQVLNGNVLREINVDAFHRQVRPEVKPEVPGQYF